MHLSHDFYIYLKQRHFNFEFVWESIIHTYGRTATNHMCTFPGAVPILYSGDVWLYAQWEVVQVQIVFVGALSMLYI